MRHAGDSPGLPSLSELLTGVILTDLRVEIVRADARLRILDYTPGIGVYSGGRSLGGKSLTGIFPELVGSEEDIAAVAQGLHPRFDLPWVNRQTPFDSDTRYLSLVALPDPDVDGQLMLLVQDVTSEGRLNQQVIQHLNELRLLRTQLEAANDELARLDEEKSAFLRMAAHDLRSPLTVMKGYAELALHDAQAAADESAIEYLSIVLSRSRMMARLIDDLLTIERIESGDTAIQREAVNLSLLVRQVAQTLELQVKEKGLKLELDLPAEHPQILGDHDRLVQALNNLVSNALKFTPEGGQVKITVQHQDELLVLEVRDTGPGISQEDQAHLFQRFYRSDDARKQRIPGTGLGLSIVRAIIKQHRGQVYCTSRVGDGSTFGFRLPLTRG